MLWISMRTISQISHMLWSHLLDFVLVLHVVFDEFIKLYSANWLRRSRFVRSTASRDIAGAMIHSFKTIKWH